MPFVSLSQFESSAVLAPFVAQGLLHYPIVPTTCMVYEPELIMLLSNQTAWTMQQLGAQIAEMAA